MNRWTIIPVAVLALLQGCSRSQRAESTQPGANDSSRSQVTVLAQPLNRQAVRTYLTYDLTMDEAKQRFGSPGPVAVSGFLYPNWSLDDGNILELWFSLDKAKLEKAVVKTRKGEEVEVILPLR